MRNNNLINKFGVILVSTLFFFILLSNISADLILPDYQYDGYGRVISINYDDVQYSYTYTPIGYLDTITRNGIKLQFKYNSYGDVIRETLFVGGKAIPTTYTYDSSHYLIGIKDSAGNNIEYNYADNNIISEKINSNKIDYNWQDGMLTAVTYPGGLQANFQYNSNGELIHKDFSGYAVDFKYTNDSGDLRCPEQEQACFPEGSAEYYNENGMLQYDENYWYVYDNSYNLLQEISREDSDYNVTYEYYSDGLVKSAIFMPLGDKEDYSYDGLGRLVETKGVYNWGGPIDSTTSSGTGNVIKNFFTGFVTKITGKEIETPTNNNLLTYNSFMIGGEYFSVSELQELTENITLSECEVGGDIKNITESSYADYKYIVDYDTCIDNQTVRKYSCGFGMNLDFFKLKKTKTYKDYTCPFFCSDGRCITQEEFNQINETLNITLPLVNQTLLDLPPEPEKPLPL
jgi:YD repeat-containing protein